MVDLTKGKEAKLILNFAYPMLLGNVFQQLYNVVDSIVVGQYIGKEALAAVGASFPLIFLIISLIIGIGSNIEPQKYIARAISKLKQNHRLNPARDRLPGSRSRRTDLRGQPSASFVT